MLFNYERIVKEQKLHSKATLLNDALHILDDILDLEKDYRYRTRYHTGLKSFFQVSSFFLIYQTRT